MSDIYLVMNNFKKFWGVGVKFDKVSDTKAEFSI